jgi:hypothetical protein
MDIDSQKFITNVIKKLKGLVKCPVRHRELGTVEIGTRAEL